jgi:hypothetical protein
MNPPAHDSKDIFRQCTVLLEDLDVLLGAYEPLSPDEIRRLPRLARCREVAVTELAALCRDAGIDGGGVGSLEEMSRSFDEATATRRLLEQLEIVHARLDAKRMLAEARTTRHVSVFYDLARRAARYDDAIRARAAPIVALFQTRKTKGRRGDPGGTQAAAPPAGPRENGAR